VLLIKHWVRGLRLFPDRSAQAVAVFVKTSTERSSYGSRMKTVTPGALQRAETFVLLNARLLDRLRFAYHFRGGSADAVIRSLRPYQNPDGGFGNALEPDLREPGSQPFAVQHVLEALDETDRFDDPMVADVCDYLTKISRPEGGVPFALPGPADLQAPYLPITENPPASLNPTGTLAGLLYAHQVDHPWVDRAAGFCWTRIDALETTDPYEARAILAFLDHVPDRSRAEAAFERLRPVLAGPVDLDPDAPGEAHSPLDLAPKPDGLARRLFTDDIIDTHLDALIDSQHDDGGWDVNWQIWTPATGFDWRGWMTVHSLLRLRSYGRFPA
jgi:hypothetical protein